MQETEEIQVLSMGGEDPLEKGMAIHSSILAWRIPWTEEPGELQSLGCKESDKTEDLAQNSTHIYVLRLGKKLNIINHQAKANKN